MSESAATPSNRSRVLLIVIAALVVLGWLYYRESTQAVHRSISGTVTAIDTSTRRVSIRVVHPKTGQQIELTGEVPNECQILIDGKSSTLADVRVGDIADAEGVLTKANQRIVANHVTIKRSGPASASAPVTSRPTGTATSKP